MLLSHSTGQLGWWPNGQITKTVEGKSVKWAIRAILPLIWGSRLSSLSRRSEMLAASHFPSLALNCLGWLPGVTVIPFWVSWSEVEEIDHFIFHWVPEVPYDMHVLNDSVPARLRALVAETRREIWWDYLIKTARRIKKKKINLTFKNMYMNSTAGMS